MSFIARRGIEVFLDTQAAEVARLQEQAAKVTRSAILARSPGLEPEVAEMLIDAVAFRVQALYTGIESVLKDVAGEIDGFQPSGESWHARLADQMATEAGGRPALLSGPTAQLLRELRGFRHRLRHDYALAHKADRVAELATIAAAACAAFATDWAEFDRWARSAQEGTPMPDREGAAGGD